MSADDEVAALKARLAELADVQGPEMERAAQAQLRAVELEEQVAALERELRSVKRECDETAGLSGKWQDRAAKLEARAQRLAERVRELEAAQEETEHAMHMRIRAGYDKTVADAWRAAQAKVEAKAARLAEALREAREACRANLEVYARKNEPALLAALKAADAALSAAPAPVAQETKPTPCARCEAAEAREQERSEECERLTERVLDLERTNYVAGENYNAEYLRREAAEARAKALMGYAAHGFAEDGSKCPLYGHWTNSISHEPCTCGLAQHLTTEGT